MELQEYNIVDALDALIDYRGRTPKKSEKGIPTLSAKSVKMGYIDYNQCYYISKEEYDSFMVRGFPQKGDILFTTEAPLGVVAKLDRDDVAVAQRLLTLRGKKGVLDNDFLLYYLQSSEGQQRIMAKQSGSTVMGIRQEEFRKINILIPSYEEQKKIASVLSALDDKIALNKKMNQKLEAMAKRLYDYWFVQYDFPDKNGHPYKTTGGPMTYNPTLKREIPVGWEVAPISEFIEKNFNGEWGKEEASEDDIRVHCVRGADIVDMVDMPVRYISTKKKDRILNPNDIIVEISGGSPTQSTGRATFVTRNTLNRFDSPMTCSNFCQIIRLKDAKSASYFFEMWQKFYASDIFFNFEGKTSGIKNFQTDSFIATPWAHPPKELMYKFDEMYQSFMKKKERLIAENQKLTTLRDKLLPLLMNGQVVVG